MQSRNWLAKNPNLWLRPLIILVLLLLCIVLPIKGTPRQLQLLIFLIAAFFGVLVLLRRPYLGLLALIPTSLMVPFAIGTGTGTAINAAALLLSGLIFLWLFDMVAGQRKIQLVHSRTLTPLLAFIFVSIIAFGVGQLPWFPFASHASLPAQIGGLLIFILSAGAFLLVANQVRDLYWLKLLTWTFITFGALYIVSRALPGLGGIISRFFEQGATGSLFWVWLVALAFSQALYNRRLDKRWRFLLLCLVIVTFYVSTIQARGWRSGWIPSLVVVGALLALHSRRAAVTIAITASVIIPQLLREAISFDSYSYSTRLEAWSIIAEIVKVNPITGFGPANYRFYTPLFPIRGYYVPFNSHNNYVDIIAQTGLLGLTCFTWFAWEVGRTGWRLREQAPAGFPHAYAFGALGGLIGTLAAGMLGDWVLPFVYNIGLDGFRASIFGWLFLGGLVALDNIQKESLKEKKKKP